MSMGVSGVIHLIGHIIMMQMDSFNFGINTGSRPHLRSESSIDSLILIQFNTLSSWRVIINVHGSQWCNSLNRTYLYDADGFLQFPVLIRILELISVPNHFKDSFILIKFNTLPSCPEIFSLHWKLRCNSPNWTYHYDPDGFLQYRVELRVLDLIYVPNHPLIH